MTPTHSILDKVDRDASDTKDSNNVISFHSEGFVIYVGRNAESNEKLVAEHVHRTCIWMHALAARGSHVVICLAGQAQAPDTVVQYAGQLALKNSHSEGRTVKISRLEKVFKPEGGGPGVWKTSQSTTLEIC